MKIKKLPTQIQTLKQIRKPLPPPVLAFKSRKVYDRKALKGLSGE